MPKKRKSANGTPSEVESVAVITEEPKVKDEAIKAVPKAEANNRNKIVQECPRLIVEFVPGKAFNYIFENHESIRASHLKKIPIQAYRALRALRTEIVHNDK